jgi:hypothetical protein
MISPDTVSGLTIPGVMASYYLFNLLDIYFALDKITN